MIFLSWIISEVLFLYYCYLVVIIGDIEVSGIVEGAKVIVYFFL
jgi:hypothetical protein